MVSGPGMARGARVYRLLQVKRVRFVCHNLLTLSCIPLQALFMCLYVCQQLYYAVSGHDGGVELGAVPRHRVCHGS